jgi:hypothetical protein
MVRMGTSLPGSRGHLKDTSISWTSHDNMLDAMAHGLAIDPDWCGAILHYDTSTSELRPTATTSHSQGYTHFFQSMDSLVTARTSD